MRKRHRYIWMVMGIALPLLCLEAIEGIPNNVIADIPRHSCPGSITSCGDYNHSDYYHAIQVTTKTIDSLTNFKIVVKQPIKSAFTTLYLDPSGEKTTSSILIGQLSQMGDYNYQIPTDMVNGSFTLFFYDELNDKIFHEERFIEE
ncbi:MAG: hypothetical protein JXQ92_14465 [Roseivirga sp.]